MGGGVLLGHSLIMDELESFFPKIFNLTPSPLPTITHKRVLRKGVEPVQS